jgi:hypothetical protein
MAARRRHTLSPLGELGAGQRQNEEFRPSTYFNLDFYGTWRKVQYYCVSLVQSDNLLGTKCNSLIKYLWLSVHKLVFWTFNICFSVFFSLLWFNFVPY